MNPQTRLANGAVVEKKSTGDLVSLLDRLAAIFRYVQQPSTDMSSEINDVKAASTDAFLEVSILFYSGPVY